MSYEISIIVPLYNEQEVFYKLIQRLDEVLDQSQYKIQVILIDDGSIDETQSLIEQKCIKDYRFTAVFLSRNFGHQNAVTAGLNVADGSNAVFIIDGDLQDPPELVNDFYKLILEGYDVVNAVRKKRKENLFKRGLYWVFYRFLNSISSIKLTLDSGDFCMINRKVLDHINLLPEKNRYVRGLRSWVGFKQINFEYERNERIYGQSKYTYKMLFELAYNGIFSFSKFPIKFITKLGVISIIFAFIYIIILLFYKIKHPELIPKGFTSLIFIVSLFSGVQLVAIGVLGEYLVRIYDQVKNRPNYIIQNKIIDGQRIF